MNDRKLKLNYVALEERTEQYITLECLIEDTEVTKLTAGGLIYPWCSWPRLCVPGEGEGASSEQKHLSLAW